MTWYYTTKSVRIYPASELARSTKPDRRDIKSALDRIEAKPDMRLDVLALYIPASLTSFVRMVATT